MMVRIGARREPRARARTEKSDCKRDPSSYSSLLGLTDGQVGGKVARNE